MAIAHWPELPSLKPRVTFSKDEESTARDFMSNGDFSKSKSARESNFLTRWAEIKDAQEAGAG